MSTLSEILAVILMSQQVLVIGMRCCCFPKTSVDTNNNLSLGISQNPLTPPVTDEITWKITPYPTEEELNVDVIGYLSNSQYIGMSIVEREKYFSILFESRKEMIMDSINNNQTYSILKSRTVHANSFLLILTSKDSMYFSIPSNSDTHCMLHDRGLIFFRSINYENTTNVLRGCFIEFINAVLSISGIQTLSAVLYLNNGIQYTDTEMNEIISIITFIELYYNHLHRHQIARDGNRKFVLDFVYLAPSNKAKTLNVLSEYVPLNLYKKLIIIDALGLNGWNFGNLVDKAARRQDGNERIFSFLQKQIVPIQASKIAVVEPKNIIKDLFYPALCNKISFYCKELPKDIGFADSWIGSGVNPAKKPSSTLHSSRFLVPPRVESIGAWEDTQPILKISIM